MKVLRRSCSLAEVQSRLAKYTYLSRSDLPGYADGFIFQFLVNSKRHPDKTYSPSFYHWFIMMSQFAPSTIARWIENKKLYDKEDNIISHFVQHYQNPEQEQRTPFKPIRNSDFVSCGNIPRASQLGKQSEVEYIITVMLKEINIDALEILKKKLRCYDLTMSVENAIGEITINCRTSSSKHQQIANVIEKNMQFENLLVKRAKFHLPSKQSLR